MESIINDLKSALEKMNAEAVKAEKRNAELNDLISKANVKIADLTARENALNVREEKLKDIQNVADAKIAVAQSRADVNADKAAIANANKALQEAQAKIEAKDKELTQIIAIYKQKTANCDAYKAQLEADRQAMKANILEELKKGLK
jgi:hypothetical protein